jgi:hypothetical protein
MRDAVLQFVQALRRRDGNFSNRAISWLRSACFTAKRATRAEIGCITDYLSR